LIKIFIKIAISVPAQLKNCLSLSLSLSLSKKYPHKIRVTILTELLFDQINCSRIINVLDHVIECHNPLSVIGNNEKDVDNDKEEEEGGVDNASNYTIVRFLLYYQID